MKEGRVQRYALVMATMAFVPLAYAAFIAPHLDHDRRIVLAIIIFGAMFLALPRLSAWADGAEWDSGDWR